jgi:DNA-binding response OmpR family regulator
LVWVSDENAYSNHPASRGAIPVTWPPPDSLAPRAAPQPAAPQWSGEGRLRILIVDDEPDIRLSLQEALAGQLDADIVAVQDAYEAQRLLRSGRCDVVLLDHLLPGLDGAQMLSWMRNQQMLARTIVITALPNEVLSSTPLMLRGAAAVLRKPLDLGQLLTAIRGLIPASHQRMREPRP